jgi:ketosteroid isomerase-like protein
VEEAEMQNDTALGSDLEALARLNTDFIKSVEMSDVNRFSEILAQDFLNTNPDGVLLGKEQFLRQIAGPKMVSNIVAHDVNIRVLGDAAIIHARTTYDWSDGRKGAGRYTDVYARREGQWLCVAAQFVRC